LYSLTDGPFAQRGKTSRFFNGSTRGAYQDPVLAAATRPHSLVRAKADRGRRCRFPDIQPSHAVAQDGRRRIVNCATAFPWDQSARRSTPQSLAGPVGPVSRAPTDRQRPRTCRSFSAGLLIGRGPCQFLQPNGPELCSSPRRIPMFLAAQPLQSRGSFRAAAAACWNARKMRSSNVRLAARPQRVDVVHDKAGRRHPAKAYGSDTLRPRRKDPGQSGLGNVCAKNRFDTGRPPTLRRLLQDGRGDTPRTKMALEPCFAAPPYGPRRAAAKRPSRQGPRGGHPASRETP